jgi:hypothetical protein
VGQRVDGQAESILEAVFVHQLRQFVETEESPVRVCVEISSRSGPTDPSPELLSRIRHPGGVVRRSECEVGAEGVVHRASGEPAVLIAAGPITWEAQDEATVPGRYFRSPASSALPVYSVVRETEGWVCLGPVIEGLPL